MNSELIWMLLPYGCFDEHWKNSLVGQQSLLEGGDCPNFDEKPRRKNQLHLVLVDVPFRVHLRLILHDGGEGLAHE